MARGATARRSRPNALDLPCPLRYAGMRFRPVTSLLLQRGGPCMFRLCAFGLAVTLAAPAAAAQPPAGGAVDDHRWLLRVAPTPLPHGRSLSSVTFSRDGRTVTTVSDYDATVFLWD